MITAQIVGKTQLDGIFKDLLDDAEYAGLSDHDKELLFSGYAANICYTEKNMEEIITKGGKRLLSDKELENVFVEDGVEKFITNRNVLKDVITENEKKKIFETAIELGLNRANNCIDSGHHSVTDHQRYAIYFTGIPKLLAMVLNNEKDYATSEKSARYTKMKVTPEEEETYYKWIDIFKVKIKELYPNLDNEKAEKLAQENARYMISSYTPTKMLYSVSLRQLNYIMAWLKNSLESENPLYKKLKPHTEELLSALQALPIEQLNLQKNEKNRDLSLIKDDNYLPEQFAEYYALNYKGSFAQVAQAQRHRSLDYTISLPDEFECFIPKIIRDDEMLKKEWKKDIETLACNFPQGMMLNVSEGGRVEDFILKSKERLCKYAQLEICDQTKSTTERLIEGYKNQVDTAPNEQALNYYKKKYEMLQGINKGARCTQKDYTCPKPCGDKEAIALDRMI